jgi:hypothetical protein
MWIRIGKNLSFKHVITVRVPYLHVGVLHQGIEEIRGLDQTQARVAQRSNTGVHPNTNPNLRDINSN